MHTTILLHVVHCNLHSDSQSLSKVQIHLPQQLRHPMHELNQLRIPK